jgi:hypothetical protein
MTMEQNAGLNAARVVQGNHNLALNNIKMKHDGTQKKLHEMCC